MNNQEIIDNAPEGTTHTETLASTRIYYLKKDTNGMGYSVYLTNEWRTSMAVSGFIRSLADIKRIVELENEKLTLCKSELETYALVMANARRLIKANVRTSNGRLFSEIFGTGFGTGRDSARSLGLNPDCNKTDYNQMRRHIDLEALKEPRT